jgi:predicted ABC-class ATPase
MKRLKIFLTAICVICGFVSCSDFFDQDSEHVIFADDGHLNNATDTIYSVTGILNKLQALADRTILLGELRGDLTDVTANASSDLRDVANFNIGDNNIYNAPRDYYAVINNCNYFIAHADTALKNNRNEYIFMKEYAAVKAIRAWTYLQLVLNYGSVPFVTEPILTKQDSEAQYPN